MKKDIVITVILVVVIAAITFSLATGRARVAPTASTTSSVAGAASSSPGASDAVVMRVNGEPVSEREFALFITSLPEQMQAVFASGAGRRQAAQQLVRLKVLEQEGKRLGADEDPDVVARMKFGHANVVVDYAIRKLAEGSNDVLLRAEYEKERGKFELLNLSHILIAVQGGSVPPRNGQALSPDAAMLKAQSILKALHSGESFEAVARSQSDDAASAQQGGMLGTIPRGSLPPDIEAAVSKLQPGQISAPMRSQFGIHVFRLNERRAQSIEEVKPMLQQRLQQTTVTAAVDRLEKVAKVELDPKYFRADAEAPKGPPAKAPAGNAPQPGRAAQ